MSNGGVIITGSGRAERPAVVVEVLRAMASINSIRRRAASLPGYGEYLEGTVDIGVPVLISGGWQAGAKLDSKRTLMVMRQIDPIRALLDRDSKYRSYFTQITQDITDGVNKLVARRRAGSGPLSAAPVASGSTSVADMVRAQREGFLMADGVQVAGDYTTEIRAEKGGIAAPRMPPVGFPAAQSYKYPSRKMIVGAALAATPEARDFTESRRPLPTASFNPGAFVMSRPDSLNNTLIVNEPVRMPSVRDLYPRGSTYAEMASASPSEERRRNVATLLGLAEMPSVRPAPSSGLRARARFLR